jgi:hypothetical protein
MIHLSSLPALTLPNPFRLRLSEEQSSRWQAESRKPKRVFCFQRLGAQLTKFTGQCRGSSQVPMRLLATQRENLHAVSQEQGKRGDRSLGHA